MLLLELLLYCSYCYSVPTPYLVVPPLDQAWGRGAVVARDTGLGAEEEFQHKMFCSLAENIGENSLFCLVLGTAGHYPKPIVKNRVWAAEQGGGVTGVGWGDTDVFSPSLRLRTFRGFLSLNPSSFRGFHSQCLRLPTNFLLSKTGGTGVRLALELPTKEEGRISKRGRGGLGPIQIIQNSGRICWDQEVANLRRAGSRN